jgi:citrate lyase gamma subunit
MTSNGWVANVAIVLAVTAANVCIDDAGASDMSAIARVSQLVIKEQDVRTPARRFIPS